MADGSSTPATPSAKVSAIFIYPIKSCRAISVSRAPLTPTGTVISFLFCLFVFSGQECIHSFTNYFVSCNRISMG